MTNSAGAKRGYFQTTRWSLVRRAAGEGGGAAEAALAALCEAYWYPLYAYFRRAGQSAHDAEDLTQGLFARLLAKDAFAAVDAERGRLRSFLLTCARHHLTNEGQRERAQKRGAPSPGWFDPATGEDRYAREPVDLLSPDRLFQRRWAMNVLECSLAATEQEFAREGKGDLFASLRPFLGFSAASEESYEEVGAKLGLPVGTVKSHVFRLRRRWRVILFEQVAATLDDPTPERIRSELAELIGCV